MLSMSCRSDSAGNLFGSFTLSDSVVVTVTDTVTQGSQQVRTMVPNGVNSIAIVWSPSSQSITPDTPRNNAVRPIGDVVRPTGTGFAWKLNQNYPNPFD